MTTGRRFYAALAVVLLFAAAFRLYDLDRNSYWTDEFFTIQTSNGVPGRDLYLGMGPDHPDAPLTDATARRAWPEIVNALRTDNHPPLYFYLLRLWRELVGEGEGRVRVLPALCSLATIVAVAELARYRAGGAAGLWAAGLMAVSGFSIAYARDAKSYSLAVALTTVAALAIVALEAGSAPRLWALVLMTATFASLLTHYYTLGSLGAMGIYGLVALRGRTRLWVVGGLLAGALAVLLVWGSMMRVQVPNISGNNSWALDFDPHHVLRTTQRWLALPVNLYTAPSQFGATWRTCLGAIVWVGVLILAWRGKAQRLPFVWLLGGTGLVAVVDLMVGTRQLDYPRYAIMAAPALAVLLATWDARIAKVVAALVSVLSLCCLPDAYAWSYPQWRPFVAMVDEWVHPGQVLVVVDTVGGRDPTPALQALRHYSPPERRQLILLTSRAGRDTRQALQSRGQAFVVAFPSDPWRMSLPFHSILRTRTLPGWRTPALYEIRFVDRLSQ